jgi:hypothetical protein
LNIGKGAVGVKELHIDVRETSKSTLTDLDRRDLFFGAWNFQDFDKRVTLFIPGN